MGNADTQIYIGGRDFYVSEAVASCQQMHKNLTSLAWRKIAAFSEVEAEYKNVLYIDTLIQQALS